MSWTLLPAAIALLATLAAASTLVIGRRGLAWASALGWIGIVGGAVGLRAESLGLEPMRGLVPGLGMAASACLAGLVSPGGSARSNRIVALCGVVCSTAWTGLAVWASQTLSPGRWHVGTMLSSVHVAVWATALTAAAIGAVLAIERLVRRGWTPLEPDDGLREARRWSGRATAIAWLAWPLSHLLHWRMQAVVGLGAPTEWVELGTCFVLSGLWIAGADADESRIGALGTAAISVATCAVAAAAFGVSLSLGGLLGVDIPLF
jgi:hypothetical protein